MRKIYFVVIAFFALLMQPEDVEAQLSLSNISATFTITPPYSTHISEYASVPGKSLITLLSRSVGGTGTGPGVSANARVYLTLEITGTSNGVHIFTKPSYRPSQPILLQTNIPMIVDIATLSSLFDANSFVLSNITITDIFNKNGLPEGDYQFCVRAYNYDAPGTPVSAAACTSVRLTSLEPPMLNRPLDREAATPFVAQNMIFQWNIPAGADPGTQYVFRLVEMLDPSRNPNDAVNSKTAPAFFETTTSSNVFLFGPSHPHLVEGRKYAWYVTALPGPNGTAFRNFGKSEVRSFTYGRSGADAANANLTSTVRLSYPLNNALVKPVVDTFIDKTKAIGYVKWDYDKTVMASLEVPVIVTVAPGQTPQDAIRQNRNLLDGARKPNKNAVFNYGMHEGETLAWQVKITDFSGKTFLSDIQTFKVAAPSVTLAYPTSKDSKPNGNVNFMWIPSETFEKTPGGKDLFPHSSIVVAEIKKGQTPQQALQQNKNLMPGDLSSNTAVVDFSAYGGKTFAWQATVVSPGTTRKAVSEIDTFHIMSLNKDLLSKVTEFTLCGYPVKVKTIKNTDGFLFTGSGSTQLFENGPSVNISFTDLSIMPFASVLKNGVVTSYADWKATSAKDTIKLAFGREISVPVTVKQKQIEGAVTLEISSISMMPNIVTEWNNSQQCFTNVWLLVNPKATDVDFNPAFANLRFKWASEVLVTKTAVSNVFAVCSSTQSQTVKMDYAKKFAADFNSGDMGIDGDLDAQRTLTLDRNATVKLQPQIKYHRDGPSDFGLGGAYFIHGVDKDKELYAYFSGRDSMNFITGANWQYALIKDNSVRAALTKVKIHLGSSGSEPFGVSIPVLTVSFDDGAYGKTKDFQFTDVPYNSSDGLSLNTTKTLGGNDKNTDYDGFSVVLDHVTCTIDKSKLVQLKMDGSLLVPTVNQLGNYTVMVDQNGKQPASVSFNAGASTLYTDPVTGDKGIFKASTASIQPKKITVKGYFSFSNQTAGRHLNVANIASPSFDIEPNGDVSISNAGADKMANTENNATGDFNGFNVTIYKLGVYNADGIDKIGIKISGMMVLADNLTPKNNTNNFNTSVTFSKPAQQVKGGTAYHNANFGSLQELRAYKKHMAEQSVGFNTNAFGGSDNETSSFADGNLVFYENDPKYGTGFKASVGFTLKSPTGDAPPNSPTVSAILWVGHMPKYNYWYLEAGQTNAVIVPIPPTNVVIYGFKGRVYYHMKHDAGDINSAQYSPNPNSFIGLYALANLKTITDDGITFWGDLAMEITSNSKGLEAIKFDGSGNFISLGVGHAGMITAKCAMDMQWSPVKKITGNFDAKMQVPEIVVNANAGFEIGDGIFHLWGKGSGDIFSQNVGQCGFDLSKDHINLYGDLKMLDIDWSYSSGHWYICDASASIHSGVKLNVNLKYSPFHVRGFSSFYGSITGELCGISFPRISLSLDGEVELPSPTCFSAGASIVGFDIDFGVKDGKIIWGKCFDPNNITQ